MLPSPVLGRFAACSVLLLAGPALGDGLSLAEAERLWREYGREARIAAAALAGAEADLIAAAAPPNPQLSLSVGALSPQEGIGAGGWRRKRADTLLRVEQLIERGDKRALRTAAAAALRDAARDDARELRRQQRLLLHWAYYDLLLGQERVRLAEETAALHERTVAAGAARLKAGDIAPSELARLSVERQRADNELRQVRVEREAAQVALAYLIGREADPASLNVADAWPPLAPPPAGEPELGARPDVRAARARLAAAEQNRELARALRTRDVTVGLQAEHNLQNAPSNSYGVSVSLPLFVHHGHEGEIARAEAELSAAREQLERTQALARGEIDRARSALAAASERRRRFESGLVAAAREVAEAAEFAYRKGGLGLIDLLDARRTLRQVELDAAAARAEHAKGLAAWKINREWE